MASREWDAWFDANLTPFRQELQRRKDVQHFRGLCCTFGAHWEGARGTRAAAAYPALHTTPPQTAISHDFFSAAGAFAPWALPPVRTSAEVGASALPPG